MLNFKFKNFTQDDDVMLNENELAFSSNDNEDNFVDIIEADGYYVIQYFQDCVRCETKVFVKSENVQSEISDYVDNLK